MKQFERMSPPSNPTMALTLRARFVAAEQQFLSSFSSGEESLMRFAETWDSLLTDFASAKEMQQVGPDVLRLATSVAHRIAVLAESLHVLSTDADKLYDDYTDTVATVLSQDPQEFTASSPPPSPSPSPACFGDTPIHSIPTTFMTPTLDILAPSWLLQNLGDPYPSSSVKAMMAESCHCSVKDVQDWFIAARRRIGWTALSQERFGGSRRDIIEAARRAYSADTYAMDQPSDIRIAFQTIERNAHTLLPAPTSKPSLTRNERPTTSPPQPFDILLDEYDDTAPPPVLAGSKRRIDASLDATNDKFDGIALLQLPSERSSKRTKYTYKSPQQAMRNDSHWLASQPANITGGGTQYMPNCIPRTSTPTAAFDSDADAVSAREDTPFSTVPVSSLSRKRRFSDTTLDHSSKRPRGSHLEPRRPMSTPVPLDFGFDSSPIFDIGKWLSSKQDLPEAADRSHLNDFPIQDVQLCSLNAATTSNDVLLLAGSLLPASQMDISDAELASATIASFDLSGFPATGNAEQYTDISSASSPSSAGSYSELSDYKFPDNPSDVDWTQDWGQFLNIIDSLGSSPTSSQSSLSDLSPPYPPPSDSTCPPSMDDIIHTLLGVDSSFTSPDLLSDIGEFSWLRMPLEATF